MLQPRIGHCGRSTLIAFTSLATAVACGPDAPPELHGLADHIAQVGTELTIQLDGTDRTGDRLRYGFHAADLPDLDGRAEITQSPSGAGVFRWTPLAADVGLHAIDFTASDARSTATVTIAIDVRAAIGAATAPVFRQPLGSGTTLDVALRTCVELDIVVDDPDSAAVAISQVEPVIEGAALVRRDGHTAAWRWCPTREQQAEPRATLTLAADDGDNPRTVKHFLIVLRGGSGAGCPGDAPVIAHQPYDVRSSLDLAISATVSDDRGIKDAPLLYHAAAPPAALPGGGIDLAGMTLVAMTQVSGDRSAGVWGAHVASPVAGQPAGSARTLYYVIAARDDDDITGGCDHQVVSPVHTMTVTSVGAPDLASCAACSSDAQCGPGGACVRMGATGAGYCLDACGAGCPSGYSCSTSPVASIDGGRGLVCVPQSGSCERPAGPCADDAWEVNDARSDAQHHPALAPELHDLISCPGAAGAAGATRADDDWFKIVAPRDQRVDLQITGGPETDLDLHLYRSDGSRVTGSTSLVADEQIHACLPAATYYVKVNGYGAARNAYVLSYDARDEACATTCSDDGREDDDSYSQARPVTVPGAGSFTSTGNAICPGDDDWYAVRLITGQVLVVDLAFLQASAAQDLDLHLYRDGVDLTPCEPGNPSTCRVEHGQGAVSNEHATYTTPAGCETGCTYHVVVRGYDRSSNRYGITIGVR
jgi:hypothetical protein